MTDQDLKRLVFWWGSACRSMVPVMEEVQASGVATTLVVPTAVSKVRMEMGWEAFEPKVDRYTELLGPRDFAGAEKVLRQEDDATIHVIGGVMRNALHRHVVKLLQAKGVRYVIAAEAPLNMESGMRRWAKAVYQRYVIPRQIRPMDDGRCIWLNLSGDQQASLLAAGWCPSRIVPFGYFPRYANVPQSSPRIPGEPLSVISMGVLKKYKGNDLLLRALQLLDQRKVPFNCVVVGDGPDRAALERLSRELGIADKVKFTGFVPDVTLQELLAQAGVLVCPGRAEPWGIRINEAICRGLPVVASDRLGAAQLISASGAGFVFRSGDWIQLAECLGQLQIDATARDEIAVRGRSYSHEISPETAATYLRRVLLHVGSGSNGYERVPWLAWRRTAGGNRPW